MNKERLRAAVEWAHAQTAARGEVVIGRAYINGRFVRLNFKTGEVLAEYAPEP
jgi:hypothetical protein